MIQNNKIGKREMLFLNRWDFCTNYDPKIIFLNGEIGPNFAEKFRQS